MDSTKKKGFGLFRSPSKVARTKAEENTIDSELDAIFLRVIDPSTGVVFKDRTYYLKTYKSCFIGSEFVDWTLRQGIAATRQEGTAIGGKLLDGGFIEHVTKAHQFKDEGLFFHQTDREKSRGSYKDRIKRVAESGSSNESNSSAKKNNSAEKSSIREGLRDLFKKQRLEDHLGDPDGLKYFREYLKTMGNQQDINSLDFVSEVQKLVGFDSSALQTACNTIYTKYVSSTAEYRIPLSEEILSDIESRFKSADFSYDMFRDSKEYVLSSMEVFATSDYTLSKFFEKYLDEKTKNPKTLKTTALFALMDDLLVNPKHFQFRNFMDELYDARRKLEFYHAVTRWQENFDLLSVDERKKKAELIASLYLGWTGIPEKGTPVIENVDVDLFPPELLNFTFYDDTEADANSQSPEESQREKNSQNPQEQQSQQDLIISEPAKIEHVIEILNSGIIASDMFDDILYEIKQMLYEGYFMFVKGDTAQKPKESVQIDPKVTRRMYWQMQDPSSGFFMKEVTRKSKTYPLCATGTEIVDWLIKQPQQERTRSYSVSIGQDLLNQGLLKCVFPSNSSSGSSSGSSSSGPKVFTDNDNLYGWVSQGGRLTRKTGGKDVEVWIELEDVTELASMYSNDPLLGPLHSKMLGTINLDSCEILSEDSKKNTKFYLIIKEKSGKKFTFYSTNPVIRDKWLNDFTRAKNFAETSKQQTKISAMDEKCTSQFCIEGDEEEQTETIQFDSEISSSSSSRLSSQVSPKQPDINVQDFWKCTVQDYDGREQIVEDIIKDKLIFFILLRHFGCALCRRMAARMCENISQFLLMGVQVIAIGTGTPEIAKVFSKESNFPGTIFCDQKRNLYKAFNCKYGTKFLLNQKGLEAASNAAKEGFYSTPFPGSGANLQLGGAFLIQRGRGVLFSHTSKYFGDDVNLQDVINAVDEFYEENPQEAWGLWESKKKPQWSDIQAVPSSYSIISTPFVNRETGSSNPKLTATNTTLSGYPFYETFFLNKEHDIFSATDSNKNPLIICIEKTTLDRRVLIFTHLGIERCLIPAQHASSIQVMLQYLIDGQLKAFIKGDEPKANLTRANSTIGTSSTSGSKSRRGILSAFAKTKSLQITQIVPSIQVQRAIVGIEKLDVTRKCAVGVLLIESPDIIPKFWTEESKDSDFPKNFEKFMNNFSRKIVLKGFTKYRGSHDTIGGKTGIVSWFASRNDSEIMFHVSAGIPPSRRKQMIGECSVVIVFLDCDMKFEPSALSTGRNAIFIIVKRVPSPSPTATTTESTSSAPSELYECTYRIEVLAHIDVPSFSPFLPIPPTFNPSSEEFRQFILSKCLNGERQLNQQLTDKNISTRKSIMLSLTQISDNTGNPGPGIPKIRSSISLRAVTLN